MSDNYTYKNGNNYYRLYVDAYEYARGTDSTGTYSDIYAYMYIRNWQDSESRLNCTMGTGTYSITVDGESVKNGTAPALYNEDDPYTAIKKDSTIVDYTKVKRVYHTGEKTVSVVLSVAYDDSYYGSVAPGNISVTISLTLKTFDDVKPKITSLVVKEVGSDYATISITTDSACNKYNYKLNSGSYSAERSASITAGNAYDVNLQLSTNTAYTATFYVVKTSNEYKSDEVSVNFSTDRTAPNITNLSVKYASTNSVIIGITADSDCSQGKYRLNSDTYPSVLVNFGLTANVEKSFTIPNLAEDTKYTFTMYATKNSNSMNSDDASITFKTDVDQLICALVQNGVATKYKIYDHDGSKIKQAYLVSNGQGVEIGSVKS